MNKSSIFTSVFVLAFLILYLSCREDSDHAANQYDKYCGSCHLTPDPQNIPKDIWDQSELPEMAARMGIRETGYTLKHSSVEEAAYVRQSGTYPNEPTLDSSTWQELRNYILAHAPTTIHNKPAPMDSSSPISLFNTQAIQIDSCDTHGRITKIEFDRASQKLLIGDKDGHLYTWLEKNPLPFRFESPIVASSRKNDQLYLTEIGRMEPSQMALGAIHRIQQDTIETLKDNLHRPVFCKIVDLNDDGIDEIIVCEFGYHTGRLSLLEFKKGKYTKRSLLELPGSIKVEVRDMDFDGKLDIVVLISQGNEGIYILKQKNKLRFTVDQCLKMPPEYGISWFELIDYNQDGFDDLLITSGDNADYSNFLKPYHGIRLYLNDGKNGFNEKWFYPLNGATQVLADDYDKDGDVDFAVLAFFPDLESASENGFVFLENIDSEAFTFTSHTTSQVRDGNWLVMEKGDFDKDGDVDLMLGNFAEFMFMDTETNDQIDLLLFENTIRN